MTKFTPKLSDKDYNLKLVAIVDGDTNIYTYVDDEGDQMLVRVFDDTTRLPYVKGKLSLKMNPKTGRMYTVLDVIDVGTKEEFKEIELPAPWKRGTVVTGEELRRTLTDAVREAIDAVEYLNDAEGDCADYVDRKLGGKPTKKTVERWVEKYENIANEKCEPLLTNDINELHKILEDIG